MSSDANRQTKHTTILLMVKTISYLHYNFRACRATGQRYIHYTDEIEIYVLKKSDFCFTIESLPFTNNSLMNKSTTTVYLRVNHYIYNTTPEAN